MKSQKNSRMFLKTLGMGCLVSLMTLTLFYGNAQAFDLGRVTADKAAGLKDWVILDARPLKNIQAGHLPGALPFCWETYTRTDAHGVKYRTLPPGQLAQALGAMGVSHTAPILVYGDADSSWGGEGWVVWVLALLGHQGPVRFLDGGINAWQAKGLALTKKPTRPRDPVVYQPTVNKDLVWSADRVAARQQEVTLVDTRGYLTEWLPGHLPGAVHIPWEKFYQGKARTILSPKELKALLIKNGVDVTRPVVYYCTGGIRSGYTWLVHVLSGLPGAVNFEGGTEEWKAGRDLVR